MEKGDVAHTLGGAIYLGIKRDYHQYAEKGVCAISKEQVEPAEKWGWFVVGNDGDRVLVQRNHGGSMALHHILDKNRSEQE